MNGNVCRKYAARIIWFNKLLEAHGKLSGILGAEPSLHAPRSEVSTMHMIPEEAGVENSHPDFGMQNATQFFALFR